jgi:hypothetical protein
MHKRTAYKDPIYCWFDKLMDHYSIAGDLFLLLSIDSLAEVLTDDAA